VTNQESRMSSKREALLNLFCYVAARVTAIGVFAYIVPFALQDLGADRYAVLAIIMLVIGFVPLLDVGAGYALTYRYSRRLARGRDTATGLLGEHHTICIVSSLSVAIIVFFAIPLVFTQAATSVNSSFGTISVAGGVAAFFSLMSSFGRAILAARGKTYIVNLVDLASDLARATAIVVGAGIYRDLDVVVALLAVAFAFRWLLITGVIAHFFKIAPAVLLVKRRSLWASLSIGAPLAFTAVIYMLLGLIDKIVMARSFPLAEVAIYVLSYDIATKGWMVAWAVNGAILPIMMRWGHAREINKLSRATRYTWSLTFAAGIALYAPLNLFEPEIIGWWLGAEMAASAQSYIFVFSIASLFYFATANLHNSLQASGKTRVIAKAFLVGLCCYILVVVLAAASRNSLLMASAHIILWAIVAAAMWYWGSIKPSIGLDRAA
jgi:O-antigen/teichoic acid export membrane protein